VHKYHSIHPTVNFTSGWLILLTLLLQRINYTPWRWLFGGWNMLEWHIVLIKWWLYNIWETVGIWYSKCTWCTCRYMNTQCQNSKFYSFTDIFLYICMGNVMTLWLPLQKLNGEKLIKYFSVFMTQNVHNNGHKSLLMDSILSQHHLYECTILYYFFMANSGIFTPFMAISSKYSVYISYLSHAFDTQIFSAPCSYTQ
jgi:hypothetical protein